MNKFSTTEEFSGSSRSVGGLNSFGNCKEIRKKSKNWNDGHGAQEKENRNNVIANKNFSHSKTTSKPNKP